MPSHAATHYFARPLPPILPGALAAMGHGPPERTIDRTTVESLPSHFASAPAGKQSSANRCSFERLHSSPSIHTGPTPGRPLLIKRAGGPPIPWSFALMTCQSSSDSASIRRSTPLSSAPGGARQGVASTTHLYCTALSNFEIPRLGTVLGSQLVRMSLAWSRF